MAEKVSSRLKPQNFGRVMTIYVVVQTQEIERIENQVMQIRSTALADLEARLTRNQQKINQLNTELRIEVSAV